MEKLCHNCGELIEAWRDEGYGCCKAPDHLSIFEYSNELKTHQQTIKMCQDALSYVEGEYEIIKKRVDNGK